MNIFRRKRPPHHPENELQRVLGALDLTLLGIGVIIGAGVFVLTGIAAATKAGPAVTLSYFIAAIASMLAALAYAELATSIGGCGSTYNYVYAGFGEIIAWLVGWNLLFEYALAVSSVSIGWSGYFHDILYTIGIHLPDTYLKNPSEGGLINLPAVLIILALGGLLCFGVKHSARFNMAIVFIKLLTIFVFIAVASTAVKPALWHPFMPFGFSGVMQGAALVFFAYIGFDALATAVEETKNPQRNIPIGIIASIFVCSAIYIAVSVLLTGIVSYTSLNVKSPVADSLIQIGYPMAAGFIAAGALAGLTTVILVMYYGFTRISFAISRDGLLPPFFARVNSKTKTPIPIIIVSGIIMAALAGFMTLNEAAELVNIGTLTAFVFVCGGLIVLRIRHPEIPRPFKLPLHPIFPVLGMLLCFYLMLNLPLITWIRFGIWLIIGLVIYFVYGYRNSSYENESHM